jgi:hypothetical protein
MADSKYYVADGWGDSIDSPTVEEMRKFLDKLDIDDPEHCEVWLSRTESDWTLACHPYHEVVFVNDEENIPPRHLTNVSRDKMLMLWQNLAAGKLEELEKEPWLPGYTSQSTPSEPDPKELYRSFWNDLINAERIPNAKCKIEECRENPVALTVFCPKHFFEKSVKIPCPFD